MTTILQNNGDAAKSYVKDAASGYRVPMNDLDANDKSNLFYNFPAATKFENYEVGISAISLYNAFYNIKASLGNNVFEYGLVVGTNIVYRTITFADGYYTIQDIQDAIRQDQFSAGWYLVDNVGQIYWPLQIFYSPTTLRCRILLQVIQTSLPAGWVQPTGWPGYPTGVASCGFVRYNQAFSDLLGFPAYPFGIGGISGDYIIDGNRIPRIQTTISLILTINLINSIGLQNPSNTIINLPIDGSKFAELMSKDPSEIIYFPIQDGIYKRIDIVFRDQNFNKIPLLDPNVYTELIIRKRKQEKKPLPPLFNAPPLIQPKTTFFDLFSKS